MNDDENTRINNNYIVELKLQKPVQRAKSNAKRNLKGERDSPEFFQNTKPTWGVASAYSSSHGR